MKHIIYSLIAIFALILTGCADAGQNQNVNSAEIVTLDASNSTASVGGEIRTYRWRQISGPHVQLSNSHSAQPTFTAPTVRHDTNLRFLLRTVEYGGRPRHFYSFDYTKVIVKATTTDTQAPEVTLNGSENITLHVGDTYTEEGATATDNVDGTVNVVITGTVNTQNEGTYTIIYTATDHAGNHASKQRIVTVLENQDTQAPVITLLGESEVSIYQGLTYIDAGAEAEDNKDGNITNNIIINNPVNTNIIGDYTITYNVQDAADNNATEISRLVHVILPPDTQAPILTLKGASIINIKQGNPYIELGAEATDNRDGNITNNIVITGSVDTDTIGEYIISYNVTDTVGNMADELNRTVIIYEENSTIQSISGTIKDTNGSSITNATIKIGNKVGHSDNAGHYNITGIEASDRINVDVTHPDYLANSRVLVVGKNSVNLDITLGMPKATKTFASSNGTTVSHDNASVELPANGYVDENGNTYNGDIIVKMAYYPITTRSGRATFPGTFEGLDNNGSTFPIPSYGFMNVEIADPQGNKLNLNSNSIATLTFPRDDTLSSPSTIKLWYYDKAKGYWIQEGEASNAGNDSTYVGTVSHFTAWNLAYKSLFAKLKVCVEDENGTRVPNVHVLYNSVSWGYSATTDENGTMSFSHIPSNTNIMLSAYKGIDYGNFPSVINLTAEEEKVLSQCIVLKKQNNIPKTITVTGKLFNYNTSFPNKTFNIYGTGQIVTPVTSSEDASFRITFQTVSLKHYLLQTSFTVEQNKTIYDLGNILFSQGYPKIASVWQDNLEVRTNQLNWFDAIKYCQNLNLYGYTDWKLPSTEYYNDMSTAEQSWNNKFIFPGRDFGSYWLSTEYGTSADIYILGDLTSTSKTSLIGVRCVR